jgi:hypothetical protein
MSTTNKEILSVGEFLNEEAKEDISDELLADDDTLGMGVDLLDDNYDDGDLIDSLMDR